MENNKNTQYELNKGLAQMLKGGVIMDVTTPEQAKIAEAVHKTCICHVKYYFSGNATVDKSIKLCSNILYRMMVHLFRHKIDYLVILHAII